ncbi:Taste receptor type 1 member 1, partial [Eudyptes moseleyi]
MPLPALLCLCAAASFTSRGDYRLAGLFQMHAAGRRPAAGGRLRRVSPPHPAAATFKSHSYSLSQAMRFAAEEINNSSALLPNVTLGYGIHDTRSEPASLHATLRALARQGRQEVEVLPTFRHYEPEAAAAIRPDSTQLALTTVAVLSIFLIPEVNAAPPADEEQGSRGVMV